MVSTKWNMTANEHTLPNPNHGGWLWQERIMNVWLCALGCGDTERAKPLITWLHKQGRSNSWCNVGDSCCFLLGSWLVDSMPLHIRGRWVFDNRPPSLTGSLYLHTVCTSTKSCNTINIALGAVSQGLYSTRLHPVLVESLKGIQTLFTHAHRWLLGFCNYPTIPVTSKQFCEFWVDS